MTNRLDSVTEKPPPLPVVENYNFEYSPSPKISLTMHTSVDDNSTSNLPSITPSHPPLQHSNSIKYDANEPPLFDESSNSNYENFVETSPSSYPSEIVEQPSGKIVLQKPSNTLRKYIIRKFNILLIHFIIPHVSLNTFKYLKNFNNLIILNFFSSQVPNTLQRVDSTDWNRTTSRSDIFNQPTSINSGGYGDLQQQQQQPTAIYEQRKDFSRPESRNGSQSNSRPMSRAGSIVQDPIDPITEYRQRSISRSNSKSSLDEYQQQSRQPDPLITTRIEESAIEPMLDEERKSIVTFKNNEYDNYEPSNIQQMAEQRNSVYDEQSYQQQQQPQFQEPINYDQQQQQQQQQPIQQSEYQQQGDYSYDQNVVTAAAPTNYNTQEYDQQQSMGGNYTTDYDQQQYVPPTQYEQPIPYRSESRQQSPEQDYQSYSNNDNITDTTRRATPPERESPPRETIPERQQSRDQLLYDGEKPAAESPEEVVTSGSGRSSASQRQQSRESLSEASTGKSPSPKGSNNVNKSPPSPTRSNVKGKSGTSGAQQATGGKSLGEGAPVGRKSSVMSKQPATKSVSSIRGKK